MIDDPEDTSPLIPGTKYTVEDLRVLSLRLRDATEDLNDQLRQVEHLLQEKGFDPVRVPIPPFEERSKTISGHVLFWSGKCFIYEGQTKVPLLNASRAARIRAANALAALQEVHGSP